MNLSHTEIIERLGGISVVALRLRIKPPSVAGWIEGGRDGIPAGRLIELGASIERATQYYNIAGWGAGYFSVNEKGHVVVHPHGQPGPVIDLMDVVEDIRERGIGFRAVGQRVEADLLEGVDGERAQRGHREQRQVPVDRAEPDDALDEGVLQVALEVGQRGEQQAHDQEAGDGGEDPVDEVVQHMGERRAESGER